MIVSIDTIEKKLVLKRCRQILSIEIKIKRLWTSVNALKECIIT